MLAEKDGLSDLIIVTTVQALNASFQMLHRCSRPTRDLAVTSFGVSLR